MYFNHNFVWLLFRAKNSVTRDSKASMKCAILRLSTVTEGNRIHEYLSQIAHYYILVEGIKVNSSNDRCFIAILFPLVKTLQIFNKCFPRVLPFPKSVPRVLTQSPVVPFTGNIYRWDWSCNRSSRP